MWGKRKHKRNKPYANKNPWNPEIMIHDAYNESAYLRALKASNAMN